MTYGEHIRTDVIHNSHECYSAGYKEGYEAKKDETSPKNALEAHTLILEELRFIGIQLEKIAERPRGI